MENVFDLRRFLILLFKRIWIAVLIAIVLAIVGGIFGYSRVNEKVFVSTASASVNTKNELSTDATALTNIMTAVKDTISGDFFYNGVVPVIQSSLSEESYQLLFGTKKIPSTARIREVFRFYVNGNLVLCEVTAPSQELTIKASEIARNYVTTSLHSNINDIALSSRDLQTANQSMQTGETRTKNAMKFAIIGFGGGIVLYLMFIFFFDVMSLKVHNADDLKKYNLKVLGEIDNEKGGE